MKTTKPKRTLNWDDMEGIMDKEAFEQLFALMYPSLARYAATYIPCRHTCEDIVQGAFASLWEHRTSVRLSPGIRGWLFMAVRNGCLNFLKKESHKSRYGEFVHRENNPPDDDGKTILPGELYDRLEGVLAKLPEAYRSVFERHVIDRERMESVAEKLGLSVRTVKRYKAAAMEAVKRDFGDFDEQKYN